MSGGVVGGGSCGGELALSGRSRRPGALLAAVWGRLRRRWARRTRAALPAIWQATLDQTASFDPAPAGLRLTCRAGSFLVTQEADPADHVLEPGDSFESAARGKLVAWALGAGTLEVQGSLRLLRRERSRPPGVAASADMAERGALRRMDPPAGAGGTGWSGSRHPAPAGGAAARGNHSASGELQPRPVPGDAPR